MKAIDSDAFLLQDLLEEVLRLIGRELHLRSIQRKKDATHGILPRCNVFLVQRPYFNLPTVSFSCPLRVQG
jgi:hypothetical protein